MTAVSFHIKDHHPVNRGFAWLLLSYLCGTITYIITKYILTFMTEMDFLCWWYGLGLVFHAVYAMKTGSIPLEKLEPNHRGMLVLYVVLDAIATYSFFFSLRMMDPSVVSFFSQSQIIFTILLGFVFLREILEKREIAATGIIIAGMYIMTYRSAAVPLKGAVSLLFSFFCGSICLVIVRKISSHVGAVTIGRLRTVVLFVLFLGVDIAMNGRVFVPLAPLFFVILLGAFFGPFLNVIAVYKSLEYIPAGKFAIFNSILPLFVTGAAAVFLHSFPGVRETFGGIIIVLGCIVLAYFHAGHMIDRKIPLRSLWR